MKWFDCTQYKNYENLLDLKNVVIREYNSIKQKLNFQNTGMPVGELYDVSTSRDVNWFGYPIVTAEIFDETFAKFWPLTTEIIKTLPGTINCCINFVGPNSNIPSHMDHAISKEVIGDKEAIGVIIGIEMPSSDKEIVGFEVDGEIRGWSTGELVAINGYLNHSGWNRSNDWRITLLIDLDKKYWNLE